MSCHEWTGHAMGKRGQEAGCRIAVFTAQRGAMVQIRERAQLENIMDCFAAHEVDIGAIQEPGKVAGNKEQIRRWAAEEGRNYEALVYGEVGDAVTPETRSKFKLWLQPHPRGPRFQLRL